jgi:hypothetical protein
MKKIILSLSSFLLLAAVIMSFTTPVKPDLKITKSKNAAGEWEFVIHNQTKHYIDQFWVAETGPALHHDAHVWHEGHWVEGTHYIEPGATMHLTLKDAHESEYYMWTHDNHAHHGYLYKLHLDHDVDVNDEEEDADEVDDIFGKEHHEGDEIDLDDQDDD